MKNKAISSSSWPNNLIKGMILIFLRLEAKVKEGKFI